MKGIRGRAARGEFAVVFGLVILAAVILSAPPLVEAAPEAVLLILLLAYAILGNYFMITVGIRRLHDFGKSGWWYLAILIPIANIVLLISLLFVPGTSGENKYGNLNE